MNFGETYSVCLDPPKLLRFTFTFQRFFFFFLVTLKRYCSSLLWTVAVTFDREQCICALFMDPQITFFNNFFIKNGSHGTIYTFKNYFATVFSVFNFQFQQNKFYPNRPIMWILYFSLMTATTTIHFYRLLTLELLI